MKIIEIKNLVVYINNLWSMFSFAPKFTLLCIEKEYRGITITILNLEIIIVW